MSPVKCSHELFHMKRLDNNNNNNKLKVELNVAHNMT